MKTKNRTIVSAALITKDNKILLGKVREGGVYPNCWHIPGGGVDGQETKLQALQREMMEEVGLNIADCQATLLSDSDTGEAIKTEKDTGEQWLVKMRFNTFRVDLPFTSDEANVVLNDDIRECLWVPLTELKHYKHTPPSEKLFTSLGWL